MRHYAIQLWLLGLILLGTWPSVALAAPLIALPQAVTRSTLAPIPVAVALAELAQSQVIYLGETHDRAADHQAQLAIMQALYQIRPNLAIGLEMFQRPAQTVLDRYLTGKITETQLQEQSQFAQRWGFAWADYAPILRWAQTQQVPLIALNTPTEVTRKVARQGLNSLTLAERRFIPPVSAIALAPAAYRQMIQQVFESTHHGTGSDRFEQFFAAQVLWDETMAERISQFLRAHPTTTIVVLAGQGHIVYGYGIPSRVARRLAAQPTFSGKFSQSLVLLNPATELVNAPLQPPIADYFWHFGSPHSLAPPP